MNTEILTMLIGFLTIIFVVIQTNNQTRNELRIEFKSEIKEVRDDLRNVESRLSDEIKATNTRIDGTNAKIDKAESRLSDDIKATNTRIDATNIKIDTLLVGLFRGYQYQPESPKKQDEAA